MSALYTGTAGGMLTDGVVAELGPGWTGLLRQNRPGLVQVVRGPAGHVVRVGEVGSADAGRGRHAVCEALLAPSGEVEVRRHCCPPAIHLRPGQPAVPLPSDGWEAGCGELAPGDTLVMLSCALLDQAPATAAAVVELFAAAPDEFDVDLVTTMDRLLADVDTPDGALAVVVRSAVPESSRG